MYDAAGCLRYSTMTLCNIAFTSGTMFLLIAVQNDTPPAKAKEAIAKVKDHIKILGKMPWPAASVAQEILRRLKDEWTVNEEPSPPEKPTSVETLEALRNPQSDLVKLLTSMGWAPPAQNTPLSDMTAQQPQSAGLGTININDLHAQMMPSFPGLPPPLPGPGPGSFAAPSMPLMLPVPETPVLQMPSFDADHITDVQTDRERNSISPNGVN